MKIENVRFGFACNSSSTHSVLFTENSYFNDAPEYDEYGWGPFTLVDPEDKENYLLMQLLRNDSSPAFETFVRELLPKGSGMGEMDIDHQSHMNFPKNIVTKEYDRKFIEKFADLIRRENVIILGGNDNDGEHPLYDEDSTVAIADRLMSFYREIYSRYDPIYKFWTLFNPENGFKIRFSDDLSEEARDVDCSSYPELVDLKITDYCPFNCPFCYMGSTKEGVHASLEYIREIVTELSENGVFEIALGGGEPTLHPKFTEILDFIRSMGIVPNFTTRNLKFLSESDRYRSAGAVAISVSNFKEAKEVIDLIKHLRQGYTIGRQYVNTIGRQYVNTKFSLQVVAGVVRELDEILTLADSIWMPVTILGYKGNGRGSSNDSGFDITEYRKTPETILKHIDHNIRYGIDTKFAKDFPDFVRMFPSDLITESEGAFSFYIDAVEEKIAASSYSHREFDLEPGFILRQFRILEIE